MTLSNLSSAKTTAVLKAALLSEKIYIEKGGINRLVDVKGFETLSTDTVGVSVTYLMNDTSRVINELFLTLGSGRYQYWTLAGTDSRVYQLRQTELPLRVLEEKSIYRVIQLGKSSTLQIKK